VAETGEAGEAVLQRMAEPRALWASWARVAAGSRLPGVDGVSPADYAAGLPHQLDVLGRELVGGTYRPLPLRPLTVTGRGKRRRLGVPCVRDRIAQRAFLEVCGARLQAGEAEASFAYRRGRCWIDALQRAAEHRDAGRRSVARSDVRRFFDSVDHGLLNVELAALFEPPVVDLLMSWAAAPVSVGGVNRERTRGLPQGAPVSPALANVYLRSVDRTLDGGRGRLVRYADDITMFCSDDGDAFVAQAEVNAALFRLRLTANPDKTYVSNFERGFAMLGWVFFGDQGWPEQDHEHWQHPLAVVAGRPVSRGAR
jgi:RNA-directed DNA polymerase